ncbi:DnaD domain protein [Paenibacillus athensensis]|uniref:Uncharacterized protein n=1 Tax=Paenibacillus athensensis TaxID=1967502 RepID=A0A4Y8Q815_9BACL|nr:DnaD domain protein [Paenibacillus athensensis]MCD1260279.1 DnaD domain protein [Paenibacillus athensensis]
MLKSDAWPKRAEAVMAAALSERDVGVPALLLRHYRELRLSDAEALLLIHLLAFTGLEGNGFPTPEEMVARMSASAEQVTGALQKLLHDGWIAIDEGVEAASGIRFERYNLAPLYGKLAAFVLSRPEPEIAAAGHAVSGGGAGSGALQWPADDAAGALRADTSVYGIFEQEFARPLTPMELETISGWLDKDRYREELILTALKEAVFAGKVYFRYIDRILLEWSRNRVTTPEQAKEYAQRYRQSR